jgi:protein-tyrosine kinase
MSRIQQILAKAERDGTARRSAEGGDIAVIDPPRIVPPPDPPAVIEPRPPAPAMPPLETTLEAATPPVDTSSNEAVTVVLDPMLVAALDPQSLAAEQYRSLRSRISQAEQGQAIRVIQVTSPGRQDGRTVTALNLALTMAQEFQRRVLLLDADLRQPGVHALLGLPPGPGLVDVLTGAATLEEALVSLPDCNLIVLRAGRAYDRPAEMLGSAQMRRLLDTLRSQFDRIVVDSSPATVSDPGTVAPLVDRLLLVVRAGSTTKPAIARAMSVLGSPKLLGVVFNASGAAPQRRERISA